MIIQDERSLAVKEITTEGMELIEAIVNVRASYLNYDVIMVVKID